IFSHNALFTPLIALPTIGFIYVAYLSIAHSQLGKKKKKAKKSAGQEDAVVVVAVPMQKSVGQRLLLPGVLAFLVFGAGVAYYGYHTSIYPLQEASGLLARAQSAQTPQQLADYTRLAQRFIPDTGNPVWFFSTYRTDFARINAQLDGMVARSEALSTLSPHDEGYNAALIDMHA